MATLAALAAPANATDTMPWGGQYADTSHPEQTAGANQPYQHGYTGLDILNWNPAADKDSEYLRSRVPLQTRVAANAATQKNPNLPADTEMFNLAGDYGNAFFESFHDNNVFSQYLFNYWQYTDYYGTWHGQPTANVPKNLYDEKAQSDWTQKWFEFGTLNLPNAAYTNAAHKNGAKPIATIFYSGNDRGEQTYKDLLQGKRADGTYPVADKLVGIAKYYGFDGYFVNQESNVSSDDVSAYRDFMKQIVDQGIYIQWYDSATYPGGNVGYQNSFNKRNSPWVQDGTEGKISDSIFLNYWFSGNMLKDLADYAKSLGIDSKYAVFAGIEAGQKKFGNISNNADYMNVNLDADGKSYVSLAALGTDFVSHELDDDKKVYPKTKYSIVNAACGPVRPPARRVRRISPIRILMMVRVATAGRVSLRRSPSAPSSVVRSSPRHSTPVMVSNGVTAANRPAISSGATSTCKTFCQPGSGGLMPIPTRCRPTSTTARTMRRHLASATPRLADTKAAIHWY